MFLRAVDKVHIIASATETRKFPEKNLTFRLPERQLSCCGPEEAGGVQGVQEEAQAPKGGAEG